MPQEREGKVQLWAGCCSLDSCFQPLALFFVPLPPSPVGPFSRVDGSGLGMDEFSGSSPAVLGVTLGPHSPHGMLFLSFGASLC